MLYMIQFCSHIVVGCRLVKYVRFEIDRNPIGNKWVITRIFLPVTQKYQKKQGPTQLFDSFSYFNLFFQFQVIIF